MKTPGISFLCWLLCFVGFFGIHRFYNGKWVTGLIWFFTGGLLLIGQIVDLFLINSMTAQANQRTHAEFHRMQSAY